ncbi:MAG: alpha/beta fold hydrolase [Deltaproteobacteria bacterium]|nr:alpha/beta fold hydrolase [Deltaproteobacteria bacterium]
MELELLEERAISGRKRSPVLFLHGAWHGAWCWAEYFLPYFSERGFHSYALSLRGHGESEGREHLRWARITEYVSDVEKAVSQMPEAPVLVGHSMGGLVVQKYLEKNAAPAAVLLASVPVRGALGATLKIAFRHPLQFLKANLCLRMYHIVGKPRLTREAFFSEEITETKLEEYFALIQDESYLAFLDMAAFTLPNPEKVQTNMLVLGAENDRIFSSQEVEATAKAYNAKSHIFPNMAHDMMLESGWKQVADEIIAWFDQLGL